MQLFYFIFPLQLMKKKKNSFTELAGRSFMNGFSGPKCFRDFRETGPRPLVDLVGQSRQMISTRFCNLSWSVLYLFIYLFGRVAREKPFVKLRPAYSLKLFFSYVVKGIKVK